MLNDIINTFKSHSHPDNAVAMSAYMKNHFSFFGIKSPDRKAISKPFLTQSKHLNKTEAKALILNLWEEKERELHYLAMEIAEKSFKKKWDKGDVDFLVELAVKNSWWDSIDFISPKLMGAYFQSFPEDIIPYTQKWIQSDNIWLVRCALLFQLKYKDKTDLELLYKLILQSCHTKEFFINKAIGWMLRENSKRIPHEIKAFVDFHQDILSNISKKEALRLIQP